MTKVFVSFARDGGVGENLAAEMQHKLQFKGFEVFRDVAASQPGDVWYSKLEHEIIDSDIVVLIVSEMIRKSEWVHNEVSLARELGIPIITVSAESIRMPLWLRHLPILDFSNFVDWDELFRAINSQAQSNDKKKLKLDMASSAKWEGSEKVDEESLSTSNYIHLSERIERNLNAFISYSHKDKKLKEDFFDHISPLVREDKLTLWNDNAIDLGSNWYDEIVDNLEKADLVICLVSSSFIASNFCYLEEFTKALDDHKKGLKKIIPIRLRSCFWDSLAISKIQSAPSQWITSSENQDEAWTDVVMQISQYIETESTRKKKKYQEGKEQIPNL